MAATSITLWKDHQSDSGQTTGRATIWYTVICERGDLPHVAEFAVPFGIGSPLEGDPLGRSCISRRAIHEPDSDPPVYRVAVEFSNELGEVVLNPLTRKFRPALDFEERREPIYVDGSGNAIESSSHHSFDPPIEETFSDPVVTIVQNVATYRLTTWMIYKDAVNTDPFQGASPGELKVTGVYVQPLEENGVKYYQETVRITGRPNRTVGGTLVKGWARLVLDEGRYKLMTESEDGGSTHAPILDQNGDPVTDPVKLDGAGSPIDASGGPNIVGENFIASTDNKSVFRVVNPIKQAAFSGMGLVFET